MPEAPPRAAAGARRWRVAVSAAVVGAALVAAGNAYVFSCARGSIVADVAGAPTRPVALVLGNYVYPNGRPAAALAGRLATGLALYQAGRVKQVIVSGLAEPGYDEPHSMQAWLIARGVPPADIVVDVRGHRTAASMASAVELGFRSMLVVTQAYHLPRALYFARKAGIDALGVTASSSPESTLTAMRGALRETLARAEAVLEVALRGVQI
jgi:SanA protein